MNTILIHNEIEQLNQEISRRVADRTLLKYTGRPMISQRILFSLVLPKLNGERWEQGNHLSAIAAGALQAGLNAHDTIGQEASVERSGQLTVLAGDFYSGVHYRILTEIPDIHMLRTLSSAVVAISERKIGFYEHKTGTPAHRLFCDLETIEVGVVSAFLRAGGFSSYEPAVRHGLTASRLGDEITILKEGRTTSFLDALLRSGEVSGSNAAALEQLNKHRLHHISRAIEETGAIGREGGLPAELVLERLGIEAKASIQTGKKD